MDKLGSAELISAQEFTQVIFDFLGKLDVRERIGLWCQEAEKVGDYATIDEHKQFLDKFVDIFEKAGVDYYSALNNQIAEAKTERYKPVIMIEMAAIEIKFIELIIDLTLLSL